MLIHIIADHKTSNLHVGHNDKVSFVLRQACVYLTLTQGDWDLYLGITKLDHTRSLSYYNIGPGASLNMQSEAGIAKWTDEEPFSSPDTLQSLYPATPVLPVKAPSANYIPKLEISKLKVRVSRGESSKRDLPVDVFEKPSTKRTKLSLEDLDAKTTASKKVYEATKELEISTLRKRDVMIFVAEASERVERAKEELARSELDDLKASQRIADAEQMMRSAWKEMDAALGKDSA